MGGGEALDDARGLGVGHPSRKAVSAVLLKAARRRDLAPTDLALVAAGLQPLVDQLAIDLAALRSAMTGPDPQFALRVAHDVRETLDEGLAATAAAVRHFATPS